MGTSAEWLVHTALGKALGKALSKMQARKWAADRKVYTALGKVPGKADRTVRKVHTALLGKLPGNMASGKAPDR
jgi:hypothetical protein